MIPFIKIGIINTRDPKVLPRKAYLNVEDVVLVCATSGGDNTEITVRHVGAIVVNERVEIVKDMIDTAGIDPVG